MTTIQRFLTVCLCMIFCIAAYPSKATEHPLLVRMADGTEMTVRLLGDEHCHAMVTLDGYLLQEAEDGLLYYAKMQGNRLVATARKASDIERRTVSDKAFLCSLDRESIMTEWTAMANEKIQQSNARRRAARKAYPTTGECKALVILANYTDKKFSSETAQEDFWRMLNESGYNELGANGSARDWFVEASSGAFCPQFEVVGPVELSNPYTYYGKNVNGDDAHAEDMVIEACRLADEEIDFSEYDSDGDGLIDNVFVFYAGYGESRSSDRNTVWPHAYDITDYTNVPVMLDGVRLARYACSNELGSKNNMDGAGVFVHEYLHVLGLPDLYATNYTSVHSPGNWALMDAAEYANDTRTPPTICAFERFSLGWLKPTELKLPGTYVLNELKQSNEAYIVCTQNENEYFFLENRQQTGWDEYLPGHGMLVWHIDYNEKEWVYNIVNNVANHQRVDLVEADNLPSVFSEAGDAFPGTENVTSFTPETKPAFVSWKKEPLLYLTDIREEDGVITFSVNDGGNGIVSHTLQGQAADGFVNLMGQRVKGGTAGRVLVANGRKMIYGK